MKSRHPRPRLTFFAMTAALAVPLAAEPAPTPAPLSAPPQDQGLPYTRTARKFGLAKIKEHVAVFAGSRYAYVKGFKVRLDDADLRHGEAVLKDGEVYVPIAFAAVLDLKTVAPAPAPAYLADRWVYSLPLPAFGGEYAGTVQLDGKPYVPLAKLAESKGLRVYRNPRGLLLIGEKAIEFKDSESVLLDTVVTLFDTPEKFADPDVVTRSIPTLKRQGKWTDHVKVTPEQLAILNGPETKWPSAPKSEYNLTGFDFKLLGSKVPKPGVYPRILFNSEDVPLLAARVKSTKAGQMALIEMEHLFKKSWWDPKTSDGKVFEKLAKGDVAGLEWDIASGTMPSSCPQQFKGQKPGIHNSHVAYIPECLTSMALYCLLNGDDEHGRKAAAAIASYYKLREPLLDELSSVSDSEFGSSFQRADGSVIPMNGSGGQTHWRTNSGAVAHMNLGLSLDFAGKWMTADEKETMRRIIAKATYGRRAYGQDAPVRFRDVNWVTWDLPDFLAVLAIEGLEGFDPEVYASNCDTVRGFCDWGIDDSGVVYESNGKTPGSFQFFTLSMVALARRGENLWGHPHLRKLLTGQVQMTSPNGKVTVNSGTQYAPFSRQMLSFQFADELKAFFPGDRRPDYLLARAEQLFKPEDEGMRMWNLKGFSAESYREKVAKLPRLRLPSPTYPGFVHGVLYDSDFQPTKRADLHLPLDFSAPVHGVYSSYSDNTPDAAWINMMVRPDHYLGAGHHHADAGMFHFSALGVDWFTQTQFHQSYDGRYYNLVQVDGHSEAEPIPGANAYNAAGKYIGAVWNADAGCASADLTYAYSYRWLTQPSQIWDDKVNSLGWEFDPSPGIEKIFAGTARYKLRPWWANYTYSNYIATSRAPFNPMKYVYRSVGLVRGKHPYGFVIDDLNKDGKPHDYGWAAMLNGGVWKAEAPNLKPGQLVLGFRDQPDDGKEHSDPAKPAIVPQPGEPLLLVATLDAGDTNGTTCPTPKVESKQGPSDRHWKTQNYDQLMIEARTVESRFKVLLIPFRNGEEIPRIAFNAATKRGTVTWKDQADQFEFKTGDDGKTHCAVARDGRVILESK